MYKFLINLPGVIDRGFYSAERGESRWMQNLAYLLGTKYQDEFEIYCWAVDTPQFGDCAVYFQDWRGTLWNQYDALEKGPKVEWDFVMDSSWHHPIMTQFYSKFRSKVYLHGHWSCCVHEEGRFPTPQHYIAFPTQQALAFSTPCAKNHPNAHFLLPIPFLFPEQPDDTQKSQYLIWGVKEGLFRRREAHVKQRTLLLLEAARQLSIQGYTVVFPHADQLLNDPQNEYNVADIVRSFPNKIFLPERASYLEIQDLMVKSRLLFRNGAPPGAPMEYEGVAQRCFPTIYKANDNDFSRVYEAYNVALEDSYTFSDVWSRLNVLLSDTSLRNQLAFFGKGINFIHSSNDFIVSQLRSLLPI